MADGNVEDLVAQLKRENRLFRHENERLRAVVARVSERMSDDAEKLRAVLTPREGGA